ncbi:MAG TPA: hypothetical protein QF353_01160 [Gammaproteobacteria bacterium]|nr:hypothetical protein [Gammaproteobacteria bacterium]
MKRSAPSLFDSKTSKKKPKLEPKNLRSLFDGLKWHILSNQKDFLSKPGAYKLQITCANLAHSVPFRQYLISQHFTVGSLNMTHCLITDTFMLRGGEQQLTLSSEIATGYYEQYQSLPQELKQLLNDDSFKPSPFDNMALELRGFIPVKALLPYLPQEISQAVQIELMTKVYLFKIIKENHKRIEEQRSEINELRAQFKDMSQQIAILQVSQNHQPDSMR